MRLEAFCEEHGIEATFIDFDMATHTVEEAARALNTSARNIIKSLVFIVDGEPFLVVVDGTSRVDEEQLAEVLLAEEARLAEPDEVKDATGYRVGTVPPVGTGLRAVVDERVLEKDVVYGGGGTGSRMIEMDPRFIVDEDDRVEPITE